MKIKHGISFVISFMMILSMLSICPVKAETLASEGLSNNMPSEKDIVDYLKSHDISKDYEETFATPFTTRESKSSYDVSDAGALSDASQQKALTYLNTMRFIAGVDPVKLSNDLESKAQCSAYVNYLNDKMTHYPVKTDAMSQELFDKADDGSKHGNIGFGAADYEPYVKSRNLEYEIDGWLSDSNSERNWKAVGHRRWSLDPKLSTVGFGKAYGVRLNDSSWYSEHATMTYTSDDTAKKSQKGLSWPAAQMPVGFFNNSDVWSYLSVDGLKDNNITVTLTRTKSSDGAGQKTWTMTKTANDDGVVYTDYAIKGDIVGHTDAVIFKPENMDIHAGDVYNVKITGVGKTVDYDVSFFDPDNVSTESNPVTKINLDQSILNSDNQLALTKGESYGLTKYISIEPSDADDQDLSYSSSDETVATCTDGTIEALTAGETTITVKSTNDVTLTIPVKVTDQEATQTVSVPKGKTYTYDGEEHEVSLPDHVVYVDDRYSDKTATNVGDYTYYVKPEDGYTWEDGTTDEEKIKWSITKADNSAETFEADDVTYPEKPSVKAQLKYLDDDKEIMYKEENASDDEYSTEVPTTPGTYIVKVSSEGNHNVNAFENERKFIIHKGTIDTSDIVMEDQHATYDGQDHSKDMQLSGTDINDSVTLTITNQDDEQVEEAIEPGSYKVTATIHRDYYKDATKTATLTITEKEKNENAWTTPLTISSDDITYGDDYDVKAVSQYGDVTYTYQDEYGYTSSEKPTQAGTYTVIASVEGTDQYTSLKAEKRFTIKRKKVSIPDVTTRFVYDGNMHQICEYGAHYYISHASECDAGSYSSKLILYDNYEWEDGTTSDKEYSWTIEKADNEAESFNVRDVTYPEKPNVTVQLKYLDDDKNVEYKKVDASDDAYTTTVPSSPGDYDVRVTCKGSDNVRPFEEVKSFTIYNATLDASGFEMSDQTVTYDGADHSQDVQVTGTDSNDEVSYEITDENGDKVASAIEPGVYNIRATIHRDNYDDAYKYATLTITEKEKNENTWTTPLTISSDNITYGDDYKVNAESKYGDVTYTYKDKNGSVLLEKPTNAGTYTVIAQVEGTKAYTSLKDEKTFTIKRKQVAIPEITRSFTYDGKEHRVCEDGDHYHLYYAPQTSAGSYYSLLVLTSNNYEWSDGTTYSKGIYWTIAKADNSAETFDVNDVTYPEKPVVDVKLKYLDDDKKIEYKEKDASDDTYTTTLPTQPGTYCVRVTCQGSDNVNTFEKTKTFTIFKETMNTSDFTFNDVNVPYDGDDHIHDAKVTGLQDEDQVSYDITDENGKEVTSAKDPGTYHYKATIHRDHHDDVYLYATLTISKLTNAWYGPIYASSDDIRYGDDYNFFAYSRYGNTKYRYEDENDNELYEKPTEAGTYKVIATVEGTSIYTGLEAEKTFTINPEKVAIPQPVTFIYDGNTHSISETEAYSVSGSATEPGEYTATLHLKNNNNYCWEDETISDQEVTYKIVKSSDKISLDQSILENGQLILPDNNYTYDLSKYVKDEEAGLTFSSDDESVVSCRDGKLNTHNKGTANITVKDDDGAKITIPVKVISQIVQIPEGKTLTYNGTKQKGFDLPEGALYDEPNRPEGPVAKDAGYYYFYIKLKDGFIWNDGTNNLQHISWSIKKADNEAETFDVKDVTYPEQPDVTVQLKYPDDDQKVEYKKVDASDDEYSTEVPSSPGDYDVKVTCPDSKNVNSFEEVKSFTIYNATLDASGFEMSDRTVTYDGTDHSHDVQVTGTDSNDEVSYEITNENGDETTSAIEPGVYNICATIHRDNYDDVYKYATLTITETGTSTGNTETGTSTGNTGTGTSPGNTGSTSTGNTGTGTPNGNTGTGAPTDNTGTGTPTGNTETGTPTGNTKPGLTTDNTETHKPVDNTESKEKETPIVPLSTTQAIDRMVTTLKGDRDISGSKFGLLQAKGMKVTKSSIKVQWKKIKGAKGYIVYGNKCGKKYQKLKSVKGLSWTQRKLKKGTYYKYMVVAYNAKGMAIAYSKTIHVTTLGGKKANPKNIKLKSPKKLTLKVNKKAKIKASYVLAKKAKMSNHRGLAYESSNTKVARVSKKGQITAKKKGICTIYVYGQNGTMNKVQVKVQ